jgi:F0F1-type ATP synthase membrane subunit b/b'
MLKMKRSSRIKMIEQAKQQLKEKKNAAMAELKLKFLLYHEYCRKNIERQLSNKAQTKLVEKMLGDVKLN